MLAAAVAGVDDGAWRILRGHPRRAIMGMAHDDQVRIAADHAYRICQAFALGGGTRMHVRRADDGAAEAKHRGFEAESRAGRGLIEKRRHDEAVGDRQALGVFKRGREAIGEREDALDFGKSEILDRYDVIFRQPRHLKIRRPHPCPLPSGEGDPKSVISLHQ